MDDATVAPIAHLPVREVARAALEAFKNKALSAQNNGVCMYRTNNGHPCAIGAYLTDEQVEALQRLAKNGEYAQSLVSAGYFTTDDVDLLNELQAAHDNWAQGDASEDDFNKLVRELAR